MKKDRKEDKNIPFPTMGQDDFYRDSGECMDLDNELVAETNVKAELKEELTPEESKDIS